MEKEKYLMESDEEALRLDLKTDSRVVEKQAAWAGIEPGMLVADLGCGSGKTTSILGKLVQPGGRVVGLDISKERIEYAKKNYASADVEFHCRDIRQPLEELGLFDFVWIRFVLEYYRAGSMEIVRNASKMLKPGGMLCLIDLDHNCLSHHGIPERLEKTLQSIMLVLREKANFDPFAGRKLYSFLYDLNFHDIRVDVAAHHLIYGELKDADSFNWMKKIEVAPKKIQYKFEEYAGGYEEFVDEFKTFFANPRRFTYSPIISCRGELPSSSKSEI